MESLYFQAYMMLTHLRETEEKTGGGNAVNNFARFVTLLLIFILVLAVTYYTPRFVAKGQKGLARSGNMELLESLQLGPGKCLLLVRVGGHYLVLASGKEQLSLITELPEDEYRPAETNKGGSFSDILKRLKDQSPAEGDADEKKS